MITETLLNSLKSLFSSLGAKTSDSNYAVGLFDKTNGEPKGMMGISDLTLVMGVRAKILTSIIDITNLGLGAFVATRASTVSGLPTGYGDNAVFIYRNIYNNEESAVFTIVVDIEGNAGIYTRRRDDISFIKQ